MHYYPEDQSLKNLNRLWRESVCVECGRQVSIYVDPFNKRRYIACSGQIHEGITREYKPQVTDYESNIRREHELEQQIGTAATKAVATIPKQGQLTQPQAEHILELVYPGCPREEIIRCAILCRDFGLHPLMKEVYLIPFKERDEDGKVIGENYATVLGINATRKLMALRGTYSYIDDTPRLMTDAEQRRIFGEVDSNNVVAITKLRSKDGLEAPGYGRWPKNKNPKGTDKGNTKANMAFIRSERNAFGRLSPDALPANIEVIDDAYVDVPNIGLVEKATGEIVIEEATPIEATPPTPEEAGPAGHYGFILLTCPEHGDPWFTDKYGKRSHKMPEGWCNFRKQVDPIASSLAISKFKEEADMKRWIADTFDGKTWAKLTEEEQVDALGMMRALSEEPATETPIDEATAELQPEDIPF